MRCAKIFLAIFALFASFLAPLAAQDPLDRTDAAIVEEEIERQIPLYDPNDVTVPNPTSTEIPVTNTEGGFFVGAIHVEDTLIPAARFVPVIERYIGRSLSSADLQRLTSEIAAILQNEGYVFATAWIAPQRLNSGVLRIAVDEGQVGEIRFAGAHNRAVDRILAPLRDGEPVTQARLERRLLLAGDVPGIRIVETRFFREGETGVLEVAINEDRLTGWARLNNDGSEAVGPWRLQGGVVINGAVSSGDRLRLSVSATPFEPGDFGLVRLSYDVPLDDDGTTVGFSGYYARSSPDESVQVNDRDGDSIGVSLAVRHPIVRTRNTSLWGGMTLRYRTTMQDDAGIPIREDRVTTAELSLNGYTRLGPGHFSGSGRVTQGLGIFNGSQEGDALTSRFDGSGRFTKFELYGRLWHPLGAGFSIELRGGAQLASRALLAGDEMGIGGRYYGRGYDHYERSGENGVIGAIELRHDIADVFNAIDNVQLYSFFDAAGVRNLGAGDGGGRLTSAGGGVRLRISDTFSSGLEASLPLNADRFDSNDRSPRVRFQLGADF